MGRGDIKEVLEHLDQADGVMRHRMRVGQEIGERNALEGARELVQKAITGLLPYSKEDC